MIPALGSLIGRGVRVIFEDKDDPQGQRTKAWKGVLKDVSSDFIELQEDGHPSSFIAIKRIVAISVYEPED